MSLKKLFRTNGIPGIATDIPTGQSYFVSIRVTPITQRVTCWVPACGGRKFDEIKGKRRVGRLTELESDNGQITLTFNSDFSRATYDNKTEKIREEISFVWGPALNSLLQKKPKSAA